MIECNHFPFFLANCFIHLPMVSIDVRVFLCSLYRLFCCFDMFSVVDLNVFFVVKI